MYLALCACVFLLAYALNVLTITVGYHRALAHQAVRLHPLLRRAIVVWGNWITGLDPKAWVVMHRMHHAHSDTPLDPHSPVNVGLLGIGAEQLRSYKRVLVGLSRRDPAYTRFAAGLDFPINELNRRGRWYLPYVTHAAIAVVIGAATGGWLLALAYLVGMMSHPIQGGLVNALGHAVGGRNFDTDDNSRNNHLAAWLIAGEGFQNNHHRYPGSARFSYRWPEVDLGYGACLLLESAGLLEIARDQLIPTPRRHRPTSDPLHPSAERRA